MGAKCLQPQQRMVTEDKAALVNKTDDGGAANSPANIPELRTWVVFAAISTITTMSSKHSIYPKWHTQAMGKRNHMEQKTFSFQDGQDGHLPASELSQSWGLHFCVLSGQGSWSQRLLSSSASPVLVLMHLTWRRWMPPPQGAVHCGSRTDLSAWGAPFPVSCRATPTTAEPSPAPHHASSTRTQDVFTAVVPSLVPRAGFPPPLAHLSPGAHHPGGAGVRVARPGGIGPKRLLTATQLRARHQPLLLPTAARLRALPRHELSKGEARRGRRQARTPCIAVLKKHAANPPYKYKSTCKNLPPRGSLCFAATPAPSG